MFNKDIVHFQYGTESEDQGESTNFPLGLPNSKIATKMYEDSVRAFESNPVSNDVISNLLTEKRMDDYYNWMDDRITKYTACSNVIANEIASLYKRDDLNLIDCQYLVLYKKFKKILTDRGSCSNETISYLIQRLLNLVRNDLTLRNLLIVSSDDYVELILAKFVEMSLNERIYNYEYNMPRVEEQKAKNIRKHLQRTTKAASMPQSVSNACGWLDNTQYSVTPTPVPGPSLLRPDNYVSYGRRASMDNPEMREFNLNDTFVPVPRVIYPSAELPMYQPVNTMMMETKAQEPDQEQEEVKEKKKRSRRFGPRGPYKRTIIRMRMREISRKRRHIKKKAENEELEFENLENKGSENKETEPKKVEVEKEDSKKDQLEFEVVKKKMEKNAEEKEPKQEDNPKRSTRMKTKPKRYDMWLDFDDIKKISQESTTGDNSDTSEFIGWSEKKTRKKYDLSYIEKNLRKRIESIQDKFQGYPEFIYGEQLLSGQISPVESYNRLPGYISNYLNLCPELEARENIMAVRSGESTPTMIDLNPIRRQDLENISKFYSKYQMELQNNPNARLVDKPKYEMENMVRIDPEIEIMGTKNIKKGIYENVMENKNISMNDEDVLRRMGQLDSETAPLQKFKMDDPFHSKPIPENIVIRRSSRLNKNVEKENGISHKENNLEKKEQNEHENNKELELNGIKNNQEPKENEKEQELNGTEKRRGENTIWEMVQKHQKSGPGVTTNVIKQAKQTTKIIQEEKDEMSLLIKEHYHISENVPPSQTQPFPNAYKNPKSVKWTYTDTKRFYNAIETFGTDLMLVRAYLPEYTDRQVYDKFKLEERKNPQLMQNALQTHKSISLKQYEQKHGKIDISKHYDPKTDPLLQDTVVTKKKSLQLNPNHTIEVTAESNQKVDDKIINLFM